MKTTVITQQPKTNDLLKAFGYIFGLFTVLVLTFAGADLIDQLLIWIK